MEDKRFGAAEFSLGLLLGLAAGAIIGLLLTPLTGAQVRGQIAHRATGIRATVIELIDQARACIDQAAIQVEKVVGLQERNLRKQLDEIKSQLEEYHLSEA
ncbi:MAG TPA: YtxH domain-containing protein [Candidatus Aquicultor sp.]|jgi:gas vesicle protein